MTVPAPLSNSQFASLKEVGSGFCHNAIPTDDGQMLRNLGLVYSLLGALKITTAGRLRIDRGY
jgi:hypothetical protein